MGKDLLTAKPRVETSKGSGSTTTVAPQATESNAALQDKLSAAKKTGTVSGPMGRVYIRISGSPDAPGFDRSQLHNYLDNTLQLAKGEWFRGTKLDGVTDKLMQQLDKDGDGVVSWAEFKAFEAQTLSTIAPGATDAASARASAGTQFDKFDKNGDASLNYGELAAGTQAALPPGTEHGDLIAQLAARIALDAIDTDQRQSAVKDRNLSKSEWTTAAGEMAP